MTVPDPTSTALELERLRGTIGQGFAEIKGSLALLVQRSDQADRALGDHRVQLMDHEKRLGDLEQARAAGEDHEDRLLQLESGRWPLRTLGVLAALIAAAVTVLALYHS